MQIVYFLYVGADAHIGPLRNVLDMWGDVGIAPYNLFWKCIKIKADIGLDDWIEPWGKLAVKFGYAK